MIKRLLTGLLVACLAAMVSSGVVSAKDTKLRITGPDFDGSCVTLTTDGQRTVGFASIEYVDGTTIEAVIQMKHLLPNHTYNVIVHQQHPDECFFDIDGTFTTDGKGRGGASLSVAVESATSTGAFISVYEGAAGSQPQWGTAAVYAPQ